MPPENRSKLLGEILSLMIVSPTHKNYRMAHFPSIVLPPVECNQFKIYRNAEQLPVGFTSWAFLSEEAERRLLDKTLLMRDEDWNSGEKLYFMEFIAPFGHTKQMVRDLREQFRGRKGHAIRFDKDRDEVEVVEYFGYGLNTAT